LKSVFNFIIIRAMACALHPALEPDLGDHVLMLEEVEEHMYRIDRTMFHLSGNAGVRRVAGIRLGLCAPIPPNDPEFGQSEEEVIASVAGSYGAPEEVADIYRDTEVTVQTALRAPPPPPRKSLPGRFFGVIADPRTYGALFYMVLSLATGIFYFTWVITGLSLSAGLAVLIIGIPIAILFLGSVRILSLVEGRIVETMLGERMPRRPLYTARGEAVLFRVKVDTLC
jgi:hypothetical protein